MYISKILSGTVCTIYNATHQQSRTTVQKQNQRQIHTSVTVTGSPDPPVTLESKSQLLLGLYSHQLRKTCVGANTMYSRVEPLFIPQRYFAWKSSVAGRTNVVYKVVQC
jgi:hypothetical protein